MEQVVIFWPKEANAARKDLKGTGVWLKEARNLIYVISGAILIVKLENLALRLGTEGFKCSAGLRIALHCLLDNLGSKLKESECYAFYCFKTFYENSTWFLLVLFFTLRMGLALMTKVAQKSK